MEHYSTYLLHLVHLCKPFPIILLSQSQSYRHQSSQDPSHMPLDRIHPVNASGSGVFSQTSGFHALGASCKPFRPSYHGKLGKEAIKK